LGVLNVHLINQAIAVAKIHGRKTQDLRADPETS